MNARKAILILLSLVFILFAFCWCVWVWPTEWNYYEHRGVNIRVNRFTGKTQVLDDNGWHQ